MQQICVARSVIPHNRFVAFCLTKHQFVNKKTTCNYWWDITHTFHSTHCTNTFTHIHISCHIHTYRCK